MEEAEYFNDTDNSVEDDDVLSYPTSPFPAWVPSVTVAISMFIFLAGSFYCRHRKVIKKRQILMDYFYVIFQYGGMRRKRMVAALCNTNSITLRELGRSFMLSFDSVANNDNSCPFFLEDSPFPPSRCPTPSPMSQKKSFFRNRGMTTTRKYRGPFIRINTQTDENNQSSGVSFQDIVMKFKGKRHHGTAASAQGTPNRLHIPSPQYEGSSMSTIHGDDMDYQKCIDEEEAANFNRQRRNAFVALCDPAHSKYSEVYGEVGRHSLGHVIPEPYRSQQASFSGKRNSEPFQNQHGYIPGRSQCLDQQQYYFHVHGEQLSPTDVVCGSHGFIPNTNEQGGCCQYRNSEPTILIHSPSTEIDSAQRWSNIRSRNTNGIVFLKRIPKPGGAPGEFYYEEQKTPSPDLSRRVSLSKVSYVPSGNMNEYYNSLHSNTKDNPSKTNVPTDNKMCSKNPAGPSQGPSKSKRSRLSLGDLAISNFNRRIDLGSDSLHEQDTDQSSDNKGSHDSPRSTPNITWTKLKNVFSGSRAAQQLRGQDKVAKSFSVKQERQKRRRNRRTTSWQRFVGMFKGFRSLPETKKPSTSVDIPKSSNSYPLGLDVHVASYEDASETPDIESDVENRPVELHRRIYELRYDADSSSASRGSYERVASSDESEAVPKIWDRPNALNLAVKTHSFPEQLMHGCHYSNRSKAAFDASRKVQSPNGQTNGSGIRHYRKRNDRIVASLQSLPQTKKDYSVYAFQAGYSPSNDDFRSPDSTESNHGVRTPNILGSVDDPENPGQSHCIKKLSPLPERHPGSPEQSRQDNVSTDDNFDSISDTSSYWTPNEKVDTHFQSDFQPDVLSSVTIANETSNSFDDHSEANVNFTMIDTDRNYVGINHWPYNFTEYTSSDMKSKYIEKTTTRENTNMESIFVNLGEDIPDDTIPSTNNKSVFDCKGSACNLFNLSSEQRHVGLSSESVYYDTVYALDTSPCENKDICNIGMSSLECTQVRVNRGNQDCHNSVGRLVLESSAFLSDMVTKSCFSEIQQIDTLQKPLEPYVVPLPMFNMDTTARCGFINNQSLYRAQSTPILSEDDAWKHSAYIQASLPKRWTSYPLNAKTRIDTPNGQFQITKCCLNKHVDPHSRCPVKCLSLSGAHNSLNQVLDRSRPGLTGYCAPKEQYLVNVPRLSRLPGRTSRPETVSVCEMVNEN